MRGYKCAGRLCSKDMIAKYCNSFLKLHWRNLQYAYGTIVDKKCWKHSVGQTASVERETELMFQFESIRVPASAVIWLYLWYYFILINVCSASYQCAVLAVSLGPEFTCSSQIYNVLSGSNKCYLILFVCTENNWVFEPWPVGLIFPVAH